MGKEIEKFLKARKPHKTGFRLGRHIISAGPAKSFLLNEAEVKELSGKGPQHWIKEVSAEGMANAPKSNEENKERQDVIKKLRALGFSGEVEDISLSDLKDGVDELEMRAHLKSEILDLSPEHDIDDSMSTEDLELTLESINEDIESGNLEEIKEENK